MSRSAFAVLAALLFLPAPALSQVHSTGGCSPGLGCVRVRYERTGDLYRFSLNNDVGVGLWAFGWTGLGREWLPPSGVVDDYRLEFVGADLGWSLTERDGWDWVLDREAPLAWGTWFMRDPFMRLYGAPALDFSRAFTLIELGGNPVDPIYPELPPDDPPASTAPEPASLLLLGSGLAALLLTRRRAATDR